MCGNTCEEGTKKCSQAVFRGAWHQDQRQRAQPVATGVSKNQETLFTMRQVDWLIGHSHFLVMELFIVKIVYLGVP